MSEEPLPQAEAEAKAEEQGGTTLPEKRAFVVERPGNINYAHDRGHFSGCRMRYFENAGAINAFFTENANLLVVDMWPDQYQGASGVWAVYTKTLTDEEIEDFTAFNREWESRKEERKRRRQESEEAAAKAKAEAEREVKRLMDQGRTCEANHAAVIEENSKLKKELKKLKKG